MLARFTAGPEDATAMQAQASRAATLASRIADRPEEVRLRWAMGRVMPGFLGRLDPALVRDALRSALSAAAGENV